MKKIKKKKKKLFNLNNFFKGFHALGESYNSEASESSGGGSAVGWRGRRFGEIKGGNFQNLWEGIQNLEV